eukprot:CAMPEP_0185365380 /NCGR_PEP_ID=MMETSP1364-20130426/13017_1 /TAXON_ID=38817 /ORGANISM="Gephyrocapsa oceanica, Strain RCC1303" /LENGTH=321 /DNA_ID=CAMNT_0027965915 /DNA_START=419 /DNA_END=1380 /DNA_ORIENTATION=-
MPASFLHALPGLAGAWGEIWHGGALELSAFDRLAATARRPGGQKLCRSAIRRSERAAAAGALRRRRARLSVFNPPPVGSSLCRTPAHAEAARQSLCCGLYSPGMRPSFYLSSPLAARAGSSVIMGGDYAAAASALFANVRLPASIVAGVLVPLSFGYVLPREGEVFSPRTQGALIRVYRVLSTWAYVSLVVAIVDASVAINSLAENAHSPAASVADLIASEYQLPWVAMNVNFLFGLCSVFVLVALRALMTWGSDEARVAAGSCAAALLFALSTIDEQVKAGSFADGLPQLISQYCTLTLGVAGASRSPLLIGGMLAAAGS